MIAAAPALVAQCSSTWLPGDPVPCPHGEVRATTTWDPDGAGPAAPLLIAGGEFAVGTMITTGVAAFDGATWSVLGTPPMANVTALAVWNGLLVAAGGTGSQRAIATWDGTTWTVIGTANGAIHAMTVWNGNLFVGGLFRALAGLAVRSIASWNGTSWSNPGGGVGGEVRAMAALGSLYVGGSLASAGPLPIANLAVWNGTSWSSGGSFDAPIEALAPRIGTTAGTTFLFAGGTFANVGPVAAARIARFSLATGTWSSIPGLPGNSCTSLLVRSTGTFTFQLLAGVENPVSADKVHRLNGAAWTSLGPTSESVASLPRSLAFHNGRYAVGLDHASPSTNDLDCAVRLHDGTVWQPASGPGLDGPVFCSAAVGNDIVIGGAFTAANGVALNHVARGRPGAWSPLGFGLDGLVHAVCALPNGDLVAGGSFVTSNGVIVNNIARWNGTSWQAMGTGVDDPVLALAVLPNGDLIAGGYFGTAGGVPATCIARWNGSTWSALGPGMNQVVLALAVTSNGNLLAGGSFTASGGVTMNRLGLWNGSTWSALGTGLDGAVAAIAVLPNGDVVAGGPFTHAGGVLSPRVARWNGSAWLAESSATFAWDDSVITLLPLPNGDYLAGGLPSFFGLGGPFGGTDATLARHTGGAGSLAWSALPLGGDYVVTASAAANGDLFVGGRFLAAGAIANHCGAVLRPTCPATGVAYGSGCTGSGGPNVLAVQSLPWIGSTFEARATGMPASAWVFAITGLSQLSVPISLLLPEGLPGCDLLTTLDFVVAVPSTGTATAQLPLADTMSLAGVVFHQQVVPFELGPAGEIVAITATNGLRLTIGAL